MKKSVILLIHLFIFSVAISGWENPVSVRYTSTNSTYLLQPNSIIDVKDDKYPNPYLSGWNNGFFNKTVVNKIVFGIDLNQSTNFYAAFTIQAQLQIDAWDASGNAITPITTTLDLSYNPLIGNKEDLRTVYTLSGYHRVKVTVIDIKNTATNVTYIPDIVYVENFLQVERYYTVNPTSTFYGSTFANGVGYNGTSLSGNEIEVSWSPLPANETPEAYELEWTFSQDYLKDIPGTPALDYIFNVNFKNNSTSIITKSTSYKIPLIYEFGLLAWRVRAIYVNFSDVEQPLYSEWSDLDIETVIKENGSNTLINEGSNVVNNAYIFNGFEADKNWQYSISFAENGKNKAGITYYDGTLKSRQSITRVNSDGNTIVGQTIYDFTGRPAVQVLPVPTVNDLSLEYRTAFNTSAVSGNPAYNWKHFDVDATGNCTISKTHAMAATSGASQYYSQSSAGITQLGGDRIPQAEGYPFTQVEYTPDNTGRIRRQGGVGLVHRLTGTDENNSNKTGHETRYFYGTPNGQIELDRLFANEVGDYRHYKKNMVVDPNGQISISYLDPQGRVIATALAGAGSNSPDMDSINVPAQEYWTEFENTEVDYNNYTLTSHRTIMEEVGGLRTIYYKLAAPMYTDACMPVGYCFDCIYDLEISIKDDCGNELVLPENIKYMSGLLTAVNPPELNSNCSDSIILELRPANLGPVYEAFTIGLNPGKYTIYKKLTVNKEALDYYKKEYLKNISGTCYKTYEDFLTEEKAKLDYTKCNYSCDQCYIDAGSDPEKIAQCNDFCEQKDQCWGMYLLMKQDMSPGGQYFDNTSVNYINTIASNDISADDQSFSYDGNKTDQNDWLKRRLPNSTLEQAFFTDFNTRFGTQYSTWKEIRDNWESEYAEELVKLHPEYCFYEKCAELQDSYRYDQKLLTINDGTEALTNGYFNPLQMTSPKVDDTKYLPASTLTRDPLFYTSGSQNSRWTTMQDYLGNYEDASPNIVGSVWDLVDQNQLNPGSAGVETGNPNGCLSDYDWYYFRALYLAQKQKIYKDQYSHCDLNAEIVSGGETFQDLIEGKIKRYYDDAYDAFNTSNPSNSSNLVIDVSDWQDIPGKNAQLFSKAEGYCDEQCATTVDFFMEELKDCNLSTTHRDMLKDELLEICSYSCDEGSESGASSSDQYTSNGNHTFEEAFNWIMQLGGYSQSDICNPTILSFPDKNTPQQKLLAPLDQCACDKIADNETAYQDALSLGTLPAGICSEAEYFKYTWNVELEDLQLLKCLCNNDRKDTTSTLVQPCRELIDSTVTNCVDGLTPKARRLGEFISTLIQNYNFDNSSISPITNARTTFPTFFGTGSLIYSNADNSSCTPQIAFGSLSVTTTTKVRSIYITDNCGFSCTLTVTLHRTANILDFSDIQGFYEQREFETTGNSTMKVRWADAGSDMDISTTCINDLQCKYLYPKTFVPAEITCQKCLNCEDLEDYLADFKLLYPNVFEPQAQNEFIGRFTDYLNYKRSLNLTLSEVEAIFDECTQNVTCSTTTAATALTALLNKMAHNNDLGKSSVNFTPIAYPEFYNPALYSGSSGDGPKITDDNPNYFVISEGLQQAWVAGPFNITVFYPLDVIDGVSYPVIIKIVATSTTTQPTPIYVGDSLGGGNWYIIPPLTAGQVYYIYPYVNPVLLLGDPNVTLLGINFTYAGAPYATTIGIPFGNSLNLFTPSSNKSNSFTITDNTGMKCKIRFTMPDGLYAENIDSIVSIYPDPYQTGSTGTMKAKVMMKGSTTPVEVFINSSCHTLTNCGSYTATAEKCPEEIAFPEPDNDCTKRLDDLAAIQAWKRYEEYLEEKVDEFEKNYLEHCMQPFEKFGTTLKLQQYQITLYYYDKGHNLVKTVPPKGVKILDQLSLDSVSWYRADPVNEEHIEPNHDYITYYKYNTLNQLVEQTTPDAGTSHFWYDRLGRVVLSQNAKQAPDDKYSYTLYDALSRITEIGELTTTSTVTPANTANETWLVSAISTAITTATQITKTFYDDNLLAANTVPGFTQQNLRQRIAATAYYDAYTSNNQSFAHATHYTYDITGNVNQLVQDNPSLNRFQERFKTIIYNYDILTGNINLVAYQPDSLDQFYHYYEYDADNRIKGVFTSKMANWALLKYSTLPDIPNSPDWTRDAKYMYYMHGPLVRTELGNQVQGLDYGYTIHGWLKVINSTFGTSAGDGNKDGNQTTPNSMATAVDAFGMELGYYNGDYEPLTTRNPYPVIATKGAGNSITANQTSLYNGNISYTVNSIPDSAYYTSNLILQKPLATFYKYDQMNRLSQSKTLDVAAADQLYIRWLSGYNTVDDYKMLLSYDKNGNITDMTRNGEAGTTTINMDELHYNYIGNSNKLEYVDDNTGYTSNHTEDIDDQSSGNYTYDAIGNLISDAAEEIANIEWTVSEKIKKIIRTPLSQRPDLEFSYDSEGKRISKKIIPKNGEKPTTIYYIYDVNNNVLATYIHRDFEDTQFPGMDIYIEDLRVQEFHIYGNNRLGLEQVDILLAEHSYTQTQGGTQSTLYYAYSSQQNSLTNTIQLGNKNYELTDHLGNVMVVVTDKKGRKFASNGWHYFMPDIVSVTDYYPFGMVMEQRSWSIAKYRYGYNGIEKTDEVYGEGNEYNTDFRQLDTRLGRWFSPDPLSVLFPWQSPYISMDDNPIAFRDPLGLSTSTNEPTYERPSLAKRVWRTLNNESHKNRLDDYVFELSQCANKIEIIELDAHTTVVIARFDYYESAPTEYYDDNGVMYPIPAVGIAVTSQYKYSVFREQRKGGYKLLDPSTWISSSKDDDKNLTPEEFVDKFSSSDPVLDAPDPASSSASAVKKGLQVLSAGSKFWAIAQGAKSLANWKKAFKVGVTGAEDVINKGVHLHFDDLEMSIVAEGGKLLLTQSHPGKVYSALRLKSAVSLFESAMSNPSFRAHLLVRAVAAKEYLKNTSKSHKLYDLATTRAKNIAEIEDLLKNWGK